MLEDGAIYAALVQPLENLVAKQRQELAELREENAYLREKNSYLLMLLYPSSDEGNQS